MAKRKQYDDDDGRVIAKMNVDGMPWYVPPTEASSANGSMSGSDAEPEHPVTLTRKEEFWIFFGAMRAGCLIAGVCALALLITILLFLR